jgi:phenylacetate-CoA ligase
MSILDNIYHRSPVIVQQAMVATYGLFWYRRRYNSHFHKLVSEFKSRDYWTLDEFRQYQEQKLKSLFFSARSSAYYGRVFQRAGLDLEDAPFENLSKLPLLSKEMLRTNPAELLTVPTTPRNTVVFKSSGTTGTPTEIYYSPEFHALELAVPAARNLAWADIDYRQRRVMFGVRKVCRYDQSKPPFWRYSPVENMAYASIYHLSLHNLPEYMAFLRKYRPAIVMGYPNSLLILANYAAENDDFPAPAQGIFTTSETVTAQIRKALEATWKCKIYDRYGAVENCLFASECEYGRYHVSSDVGIVEILNDSNEPCSLGEMGQVVCTGLHNHLQPLIRYQIGDMARWALDQTCLCGRKMPILECIEGRFEDVCYTPDGRQMLRFDTVFKGVDSIREAQVIQNEINRFVIRLVPTGGFGEQDIEKLHHNMRLHVGNVMLDIEQVPFIERTPSGKFRAVVCNLSEDSKKIASSGSNSLG